MELEKCASAIVCRLFGGDKNCSRCCSWSNANVLFTSGPVSLNVTRGKVAVYVAAIFFISDGLGTDFQCDCYRVNDFVLVQI